MSQATDMLAAYTAAETAVLLGKEARLGDRTLVFEDLEMIRAGRREWESKVNTEAARARGVPTIGGLGFAVARLDGK